MKVVKFLLVIIICIAMVFVGYFVTKYLDKNHYLSTNLLVTFEDTKEFTLESDEVLTKEKALNIYPNKFTVENKSLKTVKYDVKLITDSKIDKEKLAYILYLNDEEIQSGKLSDIKDVLYTNNIKTLKKDYYKLYIYLTEKVSDTNFTYKLEVTSN